MPYALTGHGVNGVYFNWKEVEEIVAIFPYCKYRKFKTEEECWEFVNRFRSSKSTITMTKYGDTFDNIYVRMSYTMSRNRMYFNYNTEHFGRIKLDKTDNQLIQYTAKYVLVEEPTTLLLDRQTIISHLEVINRGVEILGELVDVDIVVPDHSIYYALTAYNGDDETINSLKNKIHNRLAEVSFTLGDE